MATRRGFLASILLTSIAAKVFRTKVDPPTAGNDSPAPNKLHDVSIFHNDSLTRCAFRAPRGKFVVGQRVTLTKTIFDGVVHSISAFPNEAYVEVECVDWASFTRTIRSDVQL